MIVKKRSQQKSLIFRTKKNPLIRAAYWNIIWLLSCIHSSLETHLNRIDSFYLTDDVSETHKWMHGGATWVEKQIRNNCLRFVFPLIAHKSWNSCERSGRKKNILWGKKCINWRFCKWNGNESLPEWKIPSRISNFFLPSRFIKWVNNNNLMFLFVSVEIKKVYIVLLLDLQMKWKRGRKEEN